MNINYYINMIIPRELIETIIHLVKLLLVFKIYFVLMFKGVVFFSTHLHLLLPNMYLFEIEHNMMTFSSNMT